MSEVLLVRVRGGQGGAALRDRDIQVVEDDYLVVEPCHDAGAAERVRRTLDAVAQSVDWLIVTSQAATRALVATAGERDVSAAFAAGRDRGIRFAAVGHATRDALARLGAADVVVPRVQTADGLLDELSTVLPGSAVLPKGDQALTTLTDGLAAGGWTVDEQVVYETKTVAERPMSADGVARGSFAAIVVRSPSAVRALVGFSGAIPESTVLICGGPTTAAEARRLGVGRVALSPSPSPAAIADTVAMSLVDAGTEPSRSDDD